MLHSGKAGGGEGMRMYTERQVVRHVVLHYICGVKPVTYRPAALRALQRMPRHISGRIVAKINAYAENPASQANNVRALRGRPGIRLRVGDWRVVMADGETLDI